MEKHPSSSHFNRMVSQTPGRIYKLDPLYTPIATPIYFLMNPLGNLFGCLEFYTEKVQVGWSWPLRWEPAGTSDFSESWGMHPESPTFLNTGIYLKGQGLGFRPGTPLLGYMPQMVPGSVIGFSALFLNQGMFGFLGRERPIFRNPKH